MLQSNPLEGRKQSLLLTAVNRFVYCEAAFLFSFVYSLPSMYMSSGGCILWYFFSLLSLLSLFFNCARCPKSIN
eukprot:m.181396 g.181396  ORF g.181396 m.181396 type:complete len:74 (-) comp16628_c4_seq2:32-253(-)